MSLLRRQPLKMTASSAVSAAAPKKLFEYEVLYYQRSNKVHKSKGVSKFDGVLTICVATGAIRLKDATANEEEDDDDDHESSDEDEVCRGKTSFASKKKNKKKQQPQKNKAIPYSGTDKALAQRCCGSDNPIQEDDTIVLGGFEVQIVTCLSKQQQSTQQKTTNRLQSNHNSVVGQNKRPISGTASGGSLVAKRTMISRPLQSKTTTTTTTKFSTSNTSTAAVATAVKPATSFQPGVNSTTRRIIPQKKPLHMSNHQPSRKQVTAPLTNKPHTVVLKQQQSTNQARYISTTATLQNTTCTVCADIPMPASIRTVLMPHQVEGIEFLWKALTSESKGAILADEMGLGKTLMCIATIMGLYRKDREKHFMVVCPTALVGQWSKEFDKFVGKASQPKRVVIQKGDSDSISRLKSVYSSTNSMGGQVLILSYELFRRVISNFNANTRIGLLVLDEGHRLKNKDGLTLKALESLPCEAKLCITATPVQNNLREFYNLANFVRPGVFGEVSVFRREFEKPIALATQKNATKEQKTRGIEQSKALDSLMKPFMLRRLQKDVLKARLPPRTEVLLFCRPTTTQAQMYETICRRATNLTMSTEALTALTNLRQLCCHPYLLRKEKSSETNKYCTGDAVALSGKLAVLESLLLAIKDEKEKVVIISNFTSVLSLIESTILQPKQMTFARLDGSTDQSERQGLVDTFNRPSSSVFAFLLSSKAGGCGLNLTGANRLVMFDADWNPATDAQAAARVYRPGQTKPCFIYRMFTTGTVEEVILQRQIAKESLVVFDKTKFHEKFTKEELADCFTLKNSHCDTKQKLGTTWLDYSGPDSLRDQGSTDGPLLQVTENSSDILSFVHIVQEKENDQSSLHVAADLFEDKEEKVAGGNSDYDSSDGESSGDDEEMEF